MTQLLSLVLACGGLGLLAVSMRRHWRQFSARPEPGARALAVMRVAGAACVFASAALCMRDGHPTIGALVWIMELALAAFCIAMAFAVAGRQRPPLD